MPDTTISAEFAHSRNGYYSQERHDFLSFIEYFTARECDALDIGSGDLSLALSSRLGRIYHVGSQRVKADNIFCVSADQRHLPFPDDHFDRVYSSCGRLTANEASLKEAVRALKRGGYMLEQLAGEKDRLELKAVFGRRIPLRAAKMGRVARYLRQSNMELFLDDEQLFHEEYPSVGSIVDLLEREPIIPGFDRIKDKEYLDDLKLFSMGDGLRLTAHRRYWVARKL